MRYKDPKLMEAILDFVNKYYKRKRISPSLGKIASALGYAKLPFTAILLK